MTMFYSKTFKCFLWVQDAPVIDKNTDEEVVAFVDKYVTCDLPTQDETLLEIVTSVQTHSKRHSKSCRKKGTVCRFTFPRLPSEETFISRSVGADDGEKPCTCKVDGENSLVSCACKKAKSDMKKEDAVKILKDIKEAILDGKADGESVQQLFARLGINQAVFQAAFNRYGRKTEVVLKRQVNAIWINQYSKALLKIWNANIDVQFVADAYACVVYIILYISKGEREIGLMLANAQREAAKEGNVSAKDAFKNLGSVFKQQRCVCSGGCIQVSKHASEGMLKESCVCASRGEFCENEFAFKCFKTEGCIKGPQHRRDVDDSPG